ncbi:serine beta-lactamase-like protein LACTB, mitochondrial isoform X1 [Gordionus sp. m RMFG-2023]|uniref:serine beta-lactamase-like protein LACTB, mitochondrial isoform X1 n=1 Tax=Gordionus sp. m RMFG-2023 TaxID=3053472 RepID=UPI0031FBE763
MRIASISKPVTLTILAKLMENDKISLDESIQKYVPNFPKKYVNNENINITLRQIVSHISGIRHYDKECKEITRNNKKKEETKDVKNLQVIPLQNEFDQFEYYLTHNYKSIKDALELFKNDELCTKPGTKFLYTTHGWTLISAAIEYVTQEPFLKTLRTFFETLDMSSTFIDENIPLIPDRSKYYVRDKASQYKLKNAQFVDNSYKWAGGGILSNVPDLLKFGQMMLYSYQRCSPYNKVDIPIKPTNLDNLQTSPLPPPGYLKCETVKQLWTPVVKTGYKSPLNSYYGMGWFVNNAPDQTKTEILNEREDAGYNDDGQELELSSGIPQDSKENLEKIKKDSSQILNECYSCENNKIASFHHSGGAVGASSILAVMVDGKGDKEPGKFGKGVIVVILTNLQEVSLTKTAIQIGKLYM